MRNIKKFASQLSVLIFLSHILCSWDSRQHILSVLDRGGHVIAERYSAGGAARAAVQVGVCY